MYDESYGLRFDIYERVHLSDELVGIDQLEEVELTPHIQVLPVGEQVTVRGSLLLSGAYIGTSEDRRSQSLEHWIPVEITLPLNRIRNLDEVRVDIETFDVDLLSTRSLNITGVLSLRGIQVEQSGSSTWEPEQFTVVHEANDFSTEPEWLRDYGESSRDLGNRAEASEIRQSEQIQQSDNASTARDESQQDASSLQESAEMEAFVQAEAEVKRLELEQLSQAPATAESPKINLISKSEIGASALEATSQAGIESFSDQLLRQPTDDDSATSNIEAESAMEAISAENTIPSNASTTWTWADSPWGNAAVQMSKAESREDDPVEEPAAIADEQGLEDRTETVDAVQELEEGAVLQEATAPVDNTEQIPEKGPMKIAIGSSKPKEAESSSTIGLSSLLRTNHQVKEKEEKEEKSLNEEAEQTVPSCDTVSDDSNWQSIFLHRVREERSFSRVRMCIVQRDDTLDMIANRYQMSPRDIAAHNQLSEPSVTEGQVLYIPLVVGG